MTGKRIALLAWKFIFPVVFKLWEITNLLLCTISNDKLIFLNNWNTYLTTHMYKIGKLVACSSPFSLWLWQSFMRYFCHILDLLIDKSASDVSKESWLNHKISVVCAVKIPEGDTAMFSWMHIPSNTTVNPRDCMMTQLERATYECLPKRMLSLRHCNAKPRTNTL